MKNILLSFVFTFLFLIGSSRAIATFDKLDVLGPNELEAAGVTQGPILIRQIEKVGDTFYAYMTDFNVYSWSAHEQVHKNFCELPSYSDADILHYGRLSVEEKNRLENVVLYLAEGEDKLYGYNMISGKIGELTSSGIEWRSERMDTSPFWNESDDLYRVMSKAYVIGDTFYGLVDNAETTPNLPWNYQIVSCNLQNGESDILPVEGIQSFCRYASDKLLLLRYMQGKDMQIEKVFSVLDLESNKMVNLNYSLPQNITMGGIAYDMQQDYIYYSASNQVFVSRKGEEFRPCAYLTSDPVFANAPGWILEDGLYAVWSDGVKIRFPKDDLSTENVLRLRGMGPDTSYNVFKMENPNVNVLFDYNRVDSSEMAKDVRGGGDRFDIYMLYADGAFRNLVKKGFVESLAASELLTADIAAMYTGIQEVLKNEKGEPIAYPFDLSIKRWQVNVELWERYFGDEELPISYVEFLDAQLRFLQDETANEDDIIFLEGYDGQSMVNDIIDVYIEETWEENTPVKFDDPDLKKTLVAFEKVREYYNTHKQKFVYPDETNDTQPDNTIFFQGGSSDVLTNTKATSYENVFRDISAPTIKEGKLVRGYMNVLVINPLSPNKDIAMRYIETIGRMDVNPKLYYMLHPNVTEPYVNPNHEREVNRIKSFCEELYMDLEKAIMEDKDQGEIDRIQSLIQRSEHALIETEQNKWLISARSISEYQQYAQSIIFFEDVPYFARGDNDGGARQVSNLCTRYATGQIDMKEFLLELERILNMIHLEMQ